MDEKGLIMKACKVTASAMHYSRMYVREYLVHMHLYGMTRQVPVNAVMEYRVHTHAYGIYFIIYTTPTFTVTCYNICVCSVCFVNIGRRCSP